MVPVYAKMSGKEGHGSYGATRINATPCNTWERQINTLKHYGTSGFCKGNVQRHEEVQPA